MPLSIAALSIMTVSTKTFSNKILRQGSLTEREGSVRLTTLYKQVQCSVFSIKNIIYQCYKTTYLIEEVNCNEPFPSVSVP
jgi:hypothetical protein